jgi:hypothetical protein
MSAPHDRASARDDADRDPWLQAALRHAPDADAAPPAVLRDAILRAARAAAPRRPSLRERIDAAWSWLARPPVAATFASVFLASAVLLMWREPPPEATDPIAREAAAPRSAPPLAAAPQATPAAKIQDAAPAAAPSQPPAAAKAAATPARAADGAARPPAEPPARDRRAAEQPPAAARQESAAMAPPEPAAAPATTATAEVGALLAKRSAVRAAAPAGATADAAPSAAAGAATLLARLLADPSGWTWAAPGGVAAPLSAPQREALAALAAAAPDWVDAEPPATPLPTLHERGQPRLALQLSGDTLLLQPAGAAAQRATLDAALAARLRAAFALPR